MASPAGLICFYCGKSFSLTALNRASGGEPCPVCAERLLQALPPLIPGPGSDPGSSNREADDALDGAPAEPAQPGDLPPDFPRPA
jgi:hypothetical protein